MTYTNSSVRRGFTLIELLVVISIIGMLASVVLAALGKTRVKAGNARVQQETQSLRTTIELSWTGTNYSTLIGDGSAGTTHVANYEWPTSINENMHILINDILKLDKLDDLGYAGGDGLACVSAPSGHAYYTIDSGGAQVYDPTKNGLTIFTNNASSCGSSVAATKYAIYSAYSPVGTAGYFCIDSTGKTLSNTTAVGIPAAPGANTTCI